MGWEDDGDWNIEVWDIVPLRYIHRNRKYIGTLQGAKKLRIKYLTAVSQVIDTQ